MKGLKLIVMFLLILIPSSTAFSQITGIDREQKEEIVSTLVEYPLVLEELNITKELLTTATMRNKHLIIINETLERKNGSLELKNKLSEKQLDIYRDRQKIPESSTGEKLLLFGSGVGAGAVLVFILKLL